VETRQWRALGREAGIRKLGSNAVESALLDVCGTQTLRALLSLAGVRDGGLSYTKGNTERASSTVRE
jgi:hypothetical protein